MLDYLSEILDEDDFPGGRAAGVGGFGVRGRKFTAANLKRVAAQVA